jgi:hypothetical protein
VKDNISGIRQQISSVFFVLGWLLIRTSHLH